jgi:hypothetical protein
MHVLPVFFELSKELLFGDRPEILLVQRSIKQQAVVQEIVGN